MAFLEFTPALELKVRAMDDEHKKLIALMNRLHELRATEATQPSSTGRIQLSRTLADLVAYTKEHFGHEETYMASIAYPKRDLHMDIHRRLLDQLVTLSAPFERGGQLGEDFFNFLKMWLVSHIKGVDRQYAESTGALGAKPAPSPIASARVPLAGAHPPAAAPRPASFAAPARPAPAPAPRPAPAAAPIARPSGTPPRRP